MTTFQSATQTAQTPLDATGAKRKSYEPPSVVVLGDASELILGGSRCCKDCCDCRFGS
jgi:hypothetical protein